MNEVGELVITQPMPSMPIYFWNDPDGERYRSSYFEMFPGVWRHGDWIKLTDRGTAVIYGRSDSTINRGGVRMGTSEIYSAVEGVPEVLDSLVVDVEDQMILFVVVREALTDELSAEIRVACASTARPGISPTGSSDRRGAAHALEQEARGAGEEDPARGGARERGESRLAREPGRARLLLRLQLAGGLSSSSSRSANSTQNSSTSASVSSSRRAPLHVIVTEGIWPTPPHSRHSARDYERGCVHQPDQLRMRSDGQQGPLSGQPQLAASNAVHVQHGRPVGHELLAVLFEKRAASL